MRKFFKTMPFVAVMAAVLVGTVGVRADDMSMTAQQVVEKMIEAHGGMERWQVAPSVSYDFIMYLSAIPVRDGMSHWDIWRVSKNMIEPRSMRAYVRLPYEGNAELAFDGKKVLNRGYKRGNAPAFRLWHHASWVNFPWLATDERVQLSEPGRRKLPSEDKEYITLRLTFSAPEGKTHDGYYEIFIDPETYLLKATLYTTAHPAIPEPLLAKKAMRIPNGMQYLRINDRFETVGGLTFPTHYSTYDETGKQLFGLHMLIDLSVTRPFVGEKLRELSRAGM